MPNNQMIEVTKRPDGGMLYSFRSPIAQAAFEEEFRSFVDGEPTDIAGAIFPICDRWGIQPIFCPAAILLPAEMPPDGACADAILKSLERYAYQHMN